MNRTSLFTRILGAGALAWALLAGCQLGTPTTGGGTEGEGVVGTLVDPAGAPLAGVWVKAYALNAAPASLAKMEAFAPDSALTNADGMFVFPGLGAGTYNLTAVTTRDGTTYALLLQGVVVTGDGLNLEADTLKVSGSVTFQVRAGGVAVEGASCYIAGSPWAALSDADGTCSIAGLPPGSLQFSISHPALPGIIAHFVPITSGQQTQGGLVTEEGGAPPPPELTSPLRGIAIRQSVNGVYLAWVATPNALTFHLQIATDSLFAQLFVNDSGLTDSTRFVGPLDSNTVYFWRVRAASANGLSPWSTWSVFRTEGGPVVSGPDTLPPPKPVMPAVITPPLSTTVPGDVVTLSWRGDTSATHRYRLLLGTDTLFTAPLLDDTLTTSGFSDIMTRVTPRLAPGTAYTWRAVAIGPGGSTASPIFSFFTAAIPTPLAPFTLSPQFPLHNATVVPSSAALRWSAPLPGAVYDLSIALDASFSTVLHRDSNLVVPQKKIDSLPPGTRIYWKVRTRIPADAGTWDGAYSVFDVAADSSSSP